MTGILLNRPTVFPTLRKDRLRKAVKLLLQPRGGPSKALDDIRKHYGREVRWERSIEPTLHVCTIPFGATRNKPRRVVGGPRLRLHLHVRGNKFRINVFSKRPLGSNSFRIALNFS